MARWIMIVYYPEERMGDRGRGWWGGAICEVYLVLNASHMK